MKTIFTKINKCLFIIALILILDFCADFLLFTTINNDIIFFVSLAIKAILLLVLCTCGSSFVDEINRMK